jgi:hypothetical protein
MKVEKILIGGQALRELGSSRYTNDVDYLIFDESKKQMFIKDEANNTDYLNASASSFFNEIYKIEKNNAIASAQSLLELKAYSWIQHLTNGNWAKAADCEFDMAFLVRELGAKMPKIVKKYVSKSEFDEIEKEIQQIKK